MKTIWKFVLATTDSQVIAMPKGARILTVQVQNGKPCLWALVDSEAPLEKRIIETFGTGHPVDRLWREHIGSYQLNDGVLVFHVFEAGPA